MCRFILQLDIPRDILRSTSSHVNPLRMHAHKFSALVLTAVLSTLTFPTKRTLQEPPSSLLSMFLLVVEVILSMQAVLLPMNVSVLNSVILWRESRFIMMVTGYLFLLVKLVVLFVMNLALLCILSLGLIL